MKASSPSPTAEPRSDYPLGLGLEEVVIWQLGEFREVRAEATLRRIAAFQPPQTEPDPFHRSSEGLTELAREALDKIHERDADACNNLLCYTNQCLGL